MIDQPQDQLWETLAEALNTYRLHKVVGTLARLVEFSAMQEYADPAEVPALERSVITLGAHLPRVQGE